MKSNMIQIVALGNDDKYLLNEPEITVWKEVSKYSGLCCDYVKKPYHQKFILYKDNQLSFKEHYSSNKKKYKNKLYYFIYSNYTKHQYDINYYNNKLYSHPDKIYYNYSLMKESKKKLHNDLIFYFSQLKYVLNFDDLL